MNRKMDRDGLVIDGNTIYEIDLDCYACLSEEEKKEFFKEKTEEEENKVEKL